MATKLIESYYKNNNRDDLDKLDTETKNQVIAIKQQLLKRGAVWIDEEVIEIVESQDGWEIAGITDYGLKAIKELADVSDISSAVLKIYLDVLDEEPMAPSDPLKVRKIEVEIEDW